MGRTDRPNTIGEREMDKVKVSVTPSIVYVVEYRPNWYSDQVNQAEFICLSTVSPFAAVEQVCQARGWTIVSIFAKEVDTIVDL